MYGSWVRAPARSQRNSEMDSFFLCQNIIDYTALSTDQVYLQFYNLKIELSSSNAIAFSGSSPSQITKGIQKWIPFFYVKTLSNNEIDFTLAEKNITRIFATAKAMIW